MRRNTTSRMWIYEVNMKPVARRRRLPTTQPKPAQFLFAPVAVTQPGPFLMLAAVCPKENRNGL